MIDEKKLIEDIIPVLKKLSADEAREVMEVIKSQHKVGEWIPCSERLPKKGRYIKVWVSFSNHVSSYTKIAHWADDKFVWDNGREIKDKPDAWMPFFAPEPYREEKDDRD